jgi:hypothetical protein
MKEIVKAAFFTPTKDGWGLPLGFEAGPGTAKSSMIEAMSEACGMHTVVLAPGERGEGAFGAVPVPEKVRLMLKGNSETDTEKAFEEVTRLRYPAPEWVDEFTNGRGVLFLDELTTAPPALQPPLLGLFLARRIGGSRLPVGVRPIAAYNAPEDAAAGYDIPKPVANRFGHIKWDAGSVDDFCDHMMNVGAGLRDDKAQLMLDPAKEEARVLAAWPVAFSLAKGVTLSFLKKFPNKLHVEPKASDPAASRAWASRRTWEFCMRAQAAATIHGLSEVDRDTLICAFVGVGIGTEFMAYVREQDMPDPIKILDGHEKFTLDPTRLDRTIAVLQACASIVVPKDAVQRDDRARRLLVVLQEVVESGRKDMAFGPARQLAKAGFVRLPEFRPILAKLNKVMEAAGIQASA